MPDPVPPPELAAFLRQQGLAGDGEPMRCKPLAGGVSSDIWRIDLPGRSVCVKRALPKLRVGADWFAPADANGGRSPFMLFVFDVLPPQARRIPAACHTDLSARVQTVSRDTNPRFHALLKAFGQRTGVPVLINTSFNVRGEPVVCTAKDALEAFHGTPIDALLIGGLLLEKPR